MPLCQGFEVFSLMSREELNTLQRIFDHIRKGNEWIKQERFDV